MGIDADACLPGADTLDGMSMNEVRPARNTMSLGVTSGALGVLTCVTGVVAMARWTSSEDSALLLAGLVVAFGAAAIAVGIASRVAGRGRGEADGAGFAPAGILMGAIGIIATIGYMVLPVVFLITMYVVVGVLYGDEMYPDEALVAAVLGAGL